MKFHVTETGFARFRSCFVAVKGAGLAVDFSRTALDGAFLTKMEGPMGEAYRQLDALESGAIANPDENRQVGHYWLRTPELAPNNAVETEIRDTLAAINRFVAQIHEGRITGGLGRPFTRLLLIGIGGSSLGPRFVADVLGEHDAPLKPYFIDNTDPDGIDRVLDELGEVLDQTVTLVVSKSGGTAETRNGMVELQGAYRAKGLAFAAHAVAITQKGSALDRVCTEEQWLASFPMWDWVGGRTSLFSAVGILPLRLLGMDTEGFLRGGRLCDEATRQKDTVHNPAALLALTWYQANRGQGGGQMVVLPYKDRLELFGKYLQQLVMESLGKEKDLDGNIVHQGLTVLGNKGSSDQHSYVQQLLDGPNNFMAVFLEVLRERKGASPLVFEESTSGDFLQAFRLGTRHALSERGRTSVTILLDQVDALCTGALIALFERAVTFYAFLTNINAYHQPAVEMGKKSAGDILTLKNELLAFLRAQPGSFTVEALAKGLHRTDPAAEETIFCLLRRLCANPQYGIAASDAPDAFDAEYRAVNPSP